MTSANFVLSGFWCLYQDVLLVRSSLHAMGFQDGVQFVVAFVTLMFLLLFTALC